MPFILAAIGVLIAAAVWYQRARAAKDAAGDLIAEVQIYETDPQGRLLSRIDASAARHGEDGLWRFEEARRCLDMAVVLDPEAGHALYHQALVLERLGFEEAAVTSFHRANALDPDHYPVPASVDTGFFERAVAEALDNLPRSIRDYVGDVPVLVEDFPGADLMANENVSPQILGLFLGVPRTVAGVTDQPQDVDRVLIFKRNLEKICLDREDLIDQIQVTVRHEIGHYLGLDEDDMERLGLA